jgi:hypothetical protein
MLIVCGHCSHCPSSLWVGGIVRHHYVVVLALTACITSEALSKGRRVGVSDVRAAWAPGQVEMSHLKWGAVLTTNDGSGRSLFGCHIAISNVAPGFNDG